jgi:hypothetical protein
MSNLATSLWASPSAIPRSAGVTNIPVTALPPTATRIRFSALKTAWPNVASTIFTVAFQISRDNQVTWSAPIVFNEPGAVVTENGASLTEAYIEINWTGPDKLPVKFGPNAFVKGSVTIGQTIPASGFTLSCQ